MKTRLFPAPILIVLVAVVGFAGCGSKKSNRQLFLESLEKNIDACAAPIIAQKGVDTLTARSVCRCMLEFQYEKDSTFFLMSEAEYKKFSDRYREEMFERCRGIVESGKSE